MQSFQSRILAKIEAEAVKAGAECSQSSDFSNVGTVNLHRPGDIVPAIRVRYDFQPDTYKLTLTVGEQRIPAQAGRAGYFDFFCGNANHSRFWECYADALRSTFKSHRKAAPLGASLTDGGPRDLRVQ